MDQTRRTLLQRVRDPQDNTAWAEFEQGYRELLVRYCRARGLQSADVDDVRQLALLNLLRGLRNFEYQPGKGRFRGYLRRVVRNAIADHLGAAGRMRAGLDTSILAAIPEADETVADDVWEREWMDHHYRKAAAALRSSCDEQSVAVFDRLLGGESVEDIAGACGMTAAAVYKVKQRLRDRMQSLIAEQVRAEDEADVEAG